MSRIRADRYTNREGTGAPTFSEGVNVVGVTSMSGDLAVTNGTITGPSQLTISGITSSISDTAVDVFVYDTSKDSDGGAWRKRTQNTSWYNETLNTATRGGRKEFPAVAVIVAEATKVTIYDGDDPDMPMWMVFNQGGSYVTSNNLIGTTAGTNSAISSLNGILSLTTGNEALYLIKFISDTSHRITNSADREYLGGIGERNSGKGLSSSNSTNYIINANCNDVAMTVLPNAPIDSATGLPVPTIAVATDGGTSIIRDDGIVADLTGFSPVTTVHIDEDNVIGTSNSGTPSHDFIFKTRIPSQDEAFTAGITAGSYNYYMTSNTGSTPLLRDINMSDSSYDSGDDVVYRGGDAGFDVIKAGQAVSSTVSNPAIAYISSDYNTGYMHGDIKLATLSDTDATNQTGGTVPDRSVNNNSLNVTGAITRTAVATGADLVGYSGWSASNYLQQPYNSDIMPGTGSFCVIGWYNQNSVTPTNEPVLLSIGSLSDTNKRLQCAVTNDNRLVLWTHEGSGSTYATTPDLGPEDPSWYQVIFLRDASGHIRIYRNGIEQSYQTNQSPGTIRDISWTDAVLQIGTPNYDTARYFEGNMSLWRFSSSIPSPEQIKKMYEDEKYLFQENSQTTLYGSSDAVTALAYDDTTELLHVGTSAGRSEFQGLRRINNTTVGITSAISASNELVAEQ